MANHTVARRNALEEQFKRSKKALGDLWVHLPLGVPHDLSRNLEKLRVWLYEHDPAPGYRTTEEKKKLAGQVRRARHRSGISSGDVPTKDDSGTESVSSS